MSEGGEARNHEEVEAVARAIRAAHGKIPPRQPIATPLAEAAIAALDQFRSSGSAAQNQRAMVEHIRDRLAYHSQPWYVLNALLAEFDYAEECENINESDGRHGLGCGCAAGLVRQFGHADGCPQPSPQGEDHEAGIEAAHRAMFGIPDRAGGKAATRAVIAAYLSRCPSPVSGTEPDDEGLSVHIDVCPECNEPASYHLMDPPMQCKHDRERYVPVRFVEAGHAREGQHAFETRMHGPSPEHDQLTRLIAGIQWVRGMCSDEEPYEVIDAKLAELLGLAGESSTTEE